MIDRSTMDMAPNGSHPAPPRNAQEAHERRISWSDGQLVEPQTLFFNITSEVATRRWDYTPHPGEYNAIDDRTRKELGPEAFREEVYRTVWHRIKHRSYEPRCLPPSQWRRVRVDNGPGYEWIKPNKSGLVQLRIPEYVISDIPERHSNMELWTGSLGQKTAPGSYLRELDQVNGVMRGILRPVITRNDSARTKIHDGVYLSPMSPRSVSRRDYFEHETVTIRSREPSPGRGA